MARRPAARAVPAVSVDAAALAAAQAAAGTALRLYVENPPLAPEAEIELPAAAARHAQVRRVQPGQRLHLFDGHGGDWPAVVLALTRSTVRVRLAGQPVPAPAHELPWTVTLAFCMPANERVDGLVEKATELGAAALQPLMSERSVLRLAGERAERRRAHWQAVAVAACEQCGRAQLPVVQPVLELAAWLREAQCAPAALWLLSTGAEVQPWALAWTTWAGSLPAAATPLARPRITLLSGPEGGFTPTEEAAARGAGFAPVSLGTRVLRADTAPLAALAWIALSHTTPKSG